MGIQKSAIVFGATGLIGGHLLRSLLEHPTYGSVTAVVRRDTGLRHPKLQQLFADLQTLNDFRSQLVADDVFCCLGTTRRKTPDLQEYYRIDHDYPVAAARLAKENGTTAFLLISAIGANPGSSNFYLRMKGETERDVIAQDIARTHIFRPSLLTGNRTEHRGLEAVSAGIFKLINPLLINGLSRYRSVPSAWVAAAMCHAAANEAAGIHTYYWQDIKQLV